MDSWCYRQRLEQIVHSLLNAYTSKVFVEELNITVYHFQNKQLIVV